MLCVRVSDCLLLLWVGLWWCLWLTLCGCCCGHAVTKHRRVNVVNHVWQLGNVLQWQANQLSNLLHAPV